MKKASWRRNLSDNYSTNKNLLHKNYEWYREMAHSKRHNYNCPAFHI